MHKLNLPKKYLSYSALEKFITRPAEFRSIYYEGRPFISTPEIRFGKHIAEQLENRDPELEYVPQYDKPEQSFKVTIDGVPLLGFIDSFDTSTKAFYEYKTGKVPWTKKRVANHLQLPIYSLAIEEKFGSVVDECELIWLETENIEVKQRGLISHEDSHTVGLTGRMERFPRVITKDEREATRQLIVDTAKAISEDYTAWQESTKVRGLV